PTKTLLFDVGSLGLTTYILRRIGGAVALAERVAAGGERDRFVVVHRHALERLANVLRGSERIGVAVRSFRIHVDETHLNRAERILEIAIACVALVSEPGGFGSPIDVLFRFPHVLASTAEAERG